MDYEPNQVVELKDKNILISCYEGMHLALHDPDFKLIRKINQISGKLIRPDELDVSEDGHIFMTNTDQSISKLSSGFELVKVYKYPNVKRHDIISICIYKDKLYAAVPDRIDVMSLDFKLISSHYLEGSPQQIKIADDRACVISCINKEFTTCFYSLPKFDLITSMAVYGSIVVHDGMFYIYDCDSGFYAFNQIGELVDHKAKVYGEPYGMSSLIRDQFLIYLPDGLCKLSFN